MRRIIEVKTECCTKIINKHDYSNEDTRTITIANVRSIAHSSQGISNLLDNWNKGDEAVKQIIPQLLGLIDKDQESINLMSNNLAKTSKLSLILLGQFQIENCIANLSKELGIQAKHRGFYTKAENLIDHLQLSKEYLDILNTPALIRNSLHSNGIHWGHNGLSYTINLKGVLYVFNNSKKVSCASMTHIAHALECSIEVLDIIFSSEELKTHTSVITDEYRLQMDYK